MPHVIIKYAHVLIYISAGEGSRHFSAFHCYSTLLYIFNILNYICIQPDAGTILNDIVSHYS